MKKAVHVFFSGRVQGVGFRYTSVGIAERLGVCGWVRNLADGRVEVWAEAEEATVEEFLTEIKREFLGYIRQAEISFADKTLDYKDFSVQF